MNRPETLGSRQQVLSQDGLIEIDPSADNSFSPETSNVRLYRFDELAWRRPSVNKSLPQMIFHRSTVGPAG